MSGGEPVDTCLLKVHTNNGVVTAIDVGDPLNANNPRENVGTQAIKTEMLSMRPCVRGRAWRQTIYSPDRLLYPMKSVGTRGQRNFVRIKWSEAISTTVTQMQNTMNKRGLYSVLGTVPALQYIGNYTFKTWGMSSYSGHQLADLVTLGMSDWGAVTDTYGDEILDLLNTKLIIGFGLNPAITIYGMNYYLALAHENGTKIILVDPVLSMSAKTFADEWIPNRPGTDAAMLAAMANVLFTENLVNTTYVNNYVEPTGFQKWKDYIMGNAAGADGLTVARTPEWAAPICAVPAATIRALAEAVRQDATCVLETLLVFLKNVHGRKPITHGCLSSSDDGKHRNKRGRLFER